MQTPTTRHRSSLKLAAVSVAVASLAIFFAPDVFGGDPTTGPIAAGKQPTSQSSSPISLATDIAPQAPPHSLLLASGSMPAADKEGQDKDKQGDDSTAASTARQVADPKNYGLWTALPAVLAILLAIFSRQVVPALIVGILAGAYMLVPCLPADSPYLGQHSIIGGFRLAMEHYLVGSIVDASAGYSHVKIIVFTMAIGFMVGVLGRNGGTAGLVRIVAGETESRRRGALATWFAGLVIFFDDYANSMIVGPTMRSVFDRLKMSRAKLAYIVDSTAAPVASIALIGTWVGAEIGYIQQGIDTAVATGVPALLENGRGGAVNGLSLFVSSLPYRFYPLLALFMVFIICLTGRDFGPMKRAETKALADEDEHPYDGGPVLGSIDGVTPRWWVGLLPVLVLVGVTMVVLFLTGSHSATDASAGAADKTLWKQAIATLEGADSYLSIFYGAILAAFAALILSFVTRACSIREAADAGLDGMARMFPAVVILVLAWSISAVEKDLMLGQIVSAKLQAAQFPIEWMPLAIFVSAAGISFATGTSWGTMGILCPVTVTVMVGLSTGQDIDPAKAMTLLQAAVGSVLAGAIFGDHCSPISDTTVLSSVASGCRHEEHVWTQLPYALITAVAAMGLGDVLCSVYGQPWYFGLAGGAVFLLLVVLIVGRRPAQPESMDIMSIVRH